MDFRKCLQFLEEYRWIFDFKVTEILEEGNLSRVPTNWSTYLQTVQLDHFSQSVISSQSRNCPDFVMRFKQKIEQCRLCFTPYEGQLVQMTQDSSRGLSEKKKHEVLNFASFIIDRCRAQDLISVFDVGSGLGYIDELLVDAGLSVIGAESNQQFHMTAIRRSKESRSRRVGRRKESSVKEGKEDVKEEKESSSLPGMNHVNLFFDNSQTTDEVLMKLVKEPSMLIALHACGDLTPDILTKFIQFEQFRCVSVVSCCYHKMKNQDNFPLSQALKCAVKEMDINFFTEYFLRLGAQETVARWERMTPEDHEVHSRNVVFRSSLEIFAKQEGILLKRKRRKPLKKEDSVSFSAFVDHLPDSYGLHLTEEEQARLWKVYKSKETLLNYAEVLTGLQFLLQQIIESLIISDRVQYLKEHQLNAQVFTIFDDFVSPRNKVIVAQRE